MPAAGSPATSPKIKTAGLFSPRLSGWAASAGDRGSSSGSVRSLAALAAAIANGDAQRAHESAESLAAGVGG